MSDRSSDTFFAAIVQCYYSTIAQWQLNLALTLLTGYFTGNGTVYFIGQPVFTSYCFQLQHLSQVFVKFRCFIFRHCIVTFYGFVYHVGLGRRTEHLVHSQIERTHTVRLLERKTMVAGCFAYYIHRSAFTFGNLAYVFNGFLFNKESHALLTFVCYNFFSRQRFVADRQFAHIDQAATFFYQLRQTVDVSGRTVVMNRYHRIFILFAKSTNHVVGTFLHFCIGTLYGIQLDSAAVATCINR